MCVLRANGDEFDVNGFVEGSGLMPYEVYRKGQRRFPNSPRNTSCFDTSGLKLEVSKTEWNKLPEQIDDAIRFLTENERELALLVAYPNVENVFIDFAYDLRIDGEKVMAQYDYLPPSIIRLAGHLGIGIALSLYPTDESV